ncbi:MAG: tetratricopeptide repeat protein [Gemmataceae bacterium]|nr:tetratricopeptide repeat protein [Gemmataceae bacterium]
MAQATRWTTRLAAAVFGLVAVIGFAAAQDDPKPKPKAEAKGDDLRAELLKLNRVTGDDAQRAAMLKFVKDKPRAKAAVAEAVKMSRAAKGEKPFNFNACWVLARTAHLLKEYDAAEYFYKQCVDLATKLDSGGKIVQAYDGLVDLYSDTKRYQDVIDTCETVLDLDKPEDVVKAKIFFLERQVQAMARAGQADQALAMAEKLIKADPDLAWYFLQLKGYVLHEAGKTQASIEAYQAALKKLDASDLEDDAKNRFKDRIRYVLSGLYVDAKDIDKAAKELQTLIKRNPDNPTYKNDLGFIWADNDLNLEECEQLLRDALALDAKRQKKAVEEGLLDEVRENAAYLDSLGWVLYKQKKYKEALTYLQRATADEDDGNHLEIWDHLADCYLALGDKAKAAATWEKALKLEDLGPKDKERRRNVVAKLKKVRGDLKGGE